jgi:hypothetical protein
MNLKTESRNFGMSWKHAYEGASPCLQSFHCQKRSRECELELELLNEQHRDIHTAMDSPHTVQGS